MNRFRFAIVCPAVMFAVCSLAPETRAASGDFVLQDIGNPSVGGVVTPVVGGFNLSAGGSSGLGVGTSDQFSFDYVQQSGDFDVKVRLAGLSPSDAWAKAGLMARTDLTASSA